MIFYPSIKNKCFFMKKYIFLLFLLFFSFFFMIQRHVCKKYFDMRQVKNGNSYKVLIVWTKGMGEKEWSMRIKNTAEKLGWQCYICSSHLNLLEKVFLSNPLEKVVKKVNPDFIVTLEGTKTINSSALHYLCLSGGANKYFGTTNKYDMRRIHGFDGYLPSFSDDIKLKQYIESIGKKYYGIKWLPTCGNSEYTDIEHKKIFYCGSNWDNKRKSKDYITLFKLLDENEYLDLYGSKKQWKHIKHSLKEKIPFDGKSFFDYMKRSGIVLVLHSNSHIIGDSPSSRIFEAAAAGCVIISDKHPFVVREFNDSILYVDQEKTGKEMFDQIEKHLKWIRNNPQKARELSKRSNQIFVNKFTLEQQLIELSEFYEKMKKEK